MKTLKKIGIGAAALLGAAALGVVSFGLELGAIHVQGFLNKERANVERQVFEDTRSFRAGLNSNFERQWLVYETARPEHRMVLCSAIKRQFSTDYTRLDTRQQRNYDSLPSCSIE